MQAPEAIFSFKEGAKNATDCDTHKEWEDKEREQ